MAQPQLARLESSARVAVRWPLLVALSALAVVGALGNAWDLYWHIVIGRDTFWIPPHTMMYTAVAISGLAALAVVLAGTLGRRAAPEQSVGLLGFRAPLGFFVLGFGALQMVLSAPVDDLWHRLYGVDVTVWSPPHLVGFSGAITMLCGLVIAATSYRQQLAADDARRGALFWLLALLLALVIRWITFLNSTTLQLSWVLEAADFAVAGPWAPWWGLWASLFIGWTFVASARLWPGRSWQLPLAVLGLTLALRAVEFPVSALGFELVLPWGTQTLRRPFRPFFSWDFGLWVTTLVLVLPALLTAWLGRIGARWRAARFGAVAGALWGLALALQFLVLRVLLSLPPIGGAMMLTVVGVALAAGLAGGLIGAVQGDWLRRFGR